VILFRYFRQSIGRIFLKKEMREMSRNLRFYNLDMAETIGVVYAYKNEEEFRLIEQLINQLHDEKKRVKVIVYIKDVKMLEYIPQRLTVDYITPVNLDLFFRPVSSYASDFIKSKFNILLDLNYGQFFPLSYIVSLSKASYKVGIFHEDNKNSLDMMIKMNPEKGLIYMIREIIRYLKIINPYENFNQ